ncbi:Nicotinamide riboside kinase [Neolecta irregularis DAH-3]|uniref:Nicotinamide riboside kinase n=1 Tax=Neolecta irregularis (strain DAH-3) TaxID=1198029 RepID=A0A1U7LVZ2_NEOID|nr:Nicotinamide riboside kinase [Neolecta irregularis DAH-3]|eukprot:OLL26789.1 Nicotinamide riboside kinase [Neolecta irregularis DAH-3]
MFQPVFRTPDDFRKSSTDLIHRHKRPNLLWKVSMDVPSSMKTYRKTLSHILKNVLDCRILYEDDFYKNRKDIPIDEATGEENWDSQESLDIPRFVMALEHIRRTGSIPENHKSIEEHQEYEMCNVSDELIEALRQKLPSYHSFKIVLIDGFLLYPVSEIHAQLDIKLLLNSSYETVKRRRMMRSGYLTQTSYWVDPPNYFDRVCWPWHVKNHTSLFKEGNMEGDVLPNFGILVQPSEMSSMEDILTWAVDVISKRLTPEF